MLLSLFKVVSVMCGLLDCVYTSLTDPACKENFLCNILPDKLAMLEKVLCCRGGQVIISTTPIAIDTFALQTLLGSCQPQLSYKVPRRELPLLGRSDAGQPGRQSEVAQDWGRPLS